MNVIVLDTETTNSIEEPLTYDIGWAVVDTETGEILKEESYAVAEIFLDKELMENAYFAEKIPSYWREIKFGSRKLARLFTIKRALANDCKAYHIMHIFAHNARFDYLSCSLTQRYLTSSKYRYFFPYKTKVYDTLKMARKTFGKNEDYKKFCKENNFVTANGQSRLTAEVLYRYMTNNKDFEEVHKGIDDVRIEKDILIECLKNGLQLEDGELW